MVDADGGLVSLEELQQQSKFYIIKPTDILQMFDDQTSCDSNKDWMRKEK